MRRCPSACVDAPHECRVPVPRHRRAGGPFPSRMATAAASAQVFMSIVASGKRWCGRNAITPVAIVPMMSLRPRFLCVLIVGILGATTIPTAQSSGAFTPAGSMTIGSIVPFGDTPAQRSSAPRGRGSVLERRPGQRRTLRSGHRHIPLCRDDDHGRGGCTAQHCFRTAAS